MGRNRLFLPLVVAFVSLTSIHFSSEVKAAELSGYYKNLVITSETVLGKKQKYWHDINRLRLEFSESWKSVDLNLIYDNEVQIGRYLDTTQFRLFAEKKDPRYWELQGNTIDRDDVYATHELYRGTLKFVSNQGDLRVGRQQINWSTATIWNPMDQFNPLSPLQLERDERLGVDSVLLDIDLDDLSRLSAAYAPGHRKKDTSTAFRYKSNFGLSDWSVMAGEFGDDVKAGFDFASQIGLVGIKSELIYNDADLTKDYIEWVLGFDYTTQSGISFVIERYFNGDGATSPQNYNYTLLFDGKKLGLARHYVGGRVAKELSPLITVELISIWNLDDGSRYFYPYLSYAIPAFEDIYLGVGTQFFVGDEQEEYGFFENIYHIEVKAYF